MDEVEKAVNPLDDAKDREEVLAKARQVIL